ncbi:hypothetical protein J1N51_02260 [Psychrosphaera ytuae]|uniref:Transmembrane protein n=1 Tax=Psychrosphaera ytuae TaxID=2820710 RepID=A0A975DE57_9GAMM|nr:hypothetical protein J1N51_02260 [Psychrosphaera ytuae]
MIHIILHFVVPAIFARTFYPQKWINAFLILIATMLVDIDHLLATPIYDPLRCSINFHPLHTLPAIAVYFVMLGFNKTRLIGFGLLIHMALDSIDCFQNVGLWMNP